MQKHGGFLFPQKQQKERATIRLQDIPIYVMIGLSGLSLLGLLGCAAHMAVFWGVPFFLGGKLVNLREHSTCTDEHCLTIFETLAGGGTIADAATQVGIDQKTLFLWYSTNKLCLAAIHDGLKAWEREKLETTRRNREQDEEHARLRQRVQDREALEELHREERQAREHRLALQKQEEDIHALRLSIEQRRQEFLEKERQEKRENELQQKRKYYSEYKQLGPPPKKRGRPRKPKQVEDVPAGDIEIKEDCKVIEEKTSNIVKFWLRRGLCRESAEIMAGERRSSALGDFTGPPQRVLSDEWCSMRY